MGNDIDISSLLTLQGQIKRDPEGFKDEFLMQFRHYKAALSIFSINPQSESKEFGDLVSFIAQVCNLYPKDTVDFPQEVINLLANHGTILYPSLRKNLVQSLLLLRNRNVVSAETLLPLCFKLFRCNDKALRQLLFSHIIQDIKRLNKKHRDEKLNRGIQNFMFDMVQDENEIAAKKSLAVLIDLYRRQIWTDAKTVNVICSACFSNSSRIMRAALKFFLGTDQVQAESDDESEEDGKPNNPVALDREAVYKAFNKGTRSTKKKKQAKLKRVLYSLKKQQRSIASGGISGQASFAALHLINDPQGFSDKLFAKLRGSSREKFEVKVMMMNLISRVIGTHKLLVLNFYPFLQKYINPHQRDVTVLLAIAIQACHDLVPPDVVEPLMRQMVNQFVHDRARPEVIAVGLNTVREMCARMPLLMTGDLLQDLALYKKAREKPVVSAARSIIALFRELAPSLLEKRDRGKGADLSAAPKAYGEVNNVAESIPGIELLEEPSEDENDEENDSAEDSENEEVDGEMSGEENQAEDLEADSQSENSELEEGEDEDEDEAEEELNSEEELEEEPSEQMENEEGSQEETEGLKSGESNNPQGESLRALKKLAALKKAQSEVGDSDGFLSNEDFQHIKRVQAKKAAEAALAKHGIKKGKGKVAHDSSLLAQRREHLSEQRVDPADLEASIKKRKEKEERLASVRAGRVGREFSAKAALKQKKSGGLTNREKQRRKAVPLGVHRQKMKARLSGKKKGAKIKATQFRGKKAWKS